MRGKSESFMLRGYVLITTMTLEVNGRWAMQQRQNSSVKSYIETRGHCMQQYGDSMILPEAAGVRSAGGEGA